MQQDNVERFLRIIGEEWLLDGIRIEPRFRVRALADLFAKCPMCGWTTDVDFDAGRAFCLLCKQKWDLRGRPVEGEGGDIEVWKRRREYVEHGNNGNGHRYNFDEPIKQEELAQCRRVTT